MLYNATGRKTTKMKTQMLIPIKLKKHVIRWPFIVVEDLNEPGIIRSDFLEVHQAEINFDRKKMKIQTIEGEEIINFMNKPYGLAMKKLKIATEAIKLPTMIRQEDKVQHRLDGIIESFPEVFAEHPRRLKNYTCRLRSKHNEPVYQRPYLIPIKRTDAIEQ